MTTSPAQARLLARVLVISPLSLVLLSPLLAVLFVVLLEQVQDIFGVV